MLAFDSSSICDCPAMGLTIHYSIRSTANSTDDARALVERMRQLALDLPFDSVTDSSTSRVTSAILSRRASKTQASASWSSKPRFR